MCRFLLIKSKKPVRPELLQQFSAMCQKSKTREGDWQGDGWGIACKEVKSQKSKVKSYEWKVYKSLKPIWEDMAELQKIPASTHFAVHARSASFLSQKGNIDYNEPFVDDRTCFVFNGIIKGVRFPYPISGTIGAQKMYSLIKKELSDNDPSETLKNVNQLIGQYSKAIEGMNIGLIVGQKLYALCEYADNEDYFGLHYSENSDLSIICSAEIGPYSWRRLPKGDIISL